MICETAKKEMTNLVRKGASVLLSVSLVWTCGVAPSAWADEVVDSVSPDMTSQDESIELDEQAVGNRASSGEGQEEGPSPEDNVETGGEAGDDPTNGVQSERVDVADLWEAGGAAISAGGEYYLSRDIETSGMLSIEAPVGETVRLDFLGHAATVKGAAYAGIDVGGSFGTVEIVDSAYEEGEPKAGLKVIGEGVADALCGIQASYREVGAEGAPSPKLTVRGVAVDVHLAAVEEASSDSKHDAFGVYVGFADAKDERKPADTLFSDVRICVSVGTNGDELVELEDAGLSAVIDDNAGVAYGVYTTSGLVALGGRFESSTASSGGSCDLYSVEDALFELASDFDPQGTMRVYAGSNGDGRVLATAREGLPIDSDLLQCFESAVGSDVVLKADGNRVCFFAEEEADKRELDDPEDETRAQIDESGATADRSDSAVDREKIEPQESLETQEAKNLKGASSELVTITIHSNYPDKSLQEEVEVLEGKPGDKISYDNIRQFVCTYWTYAGTAFLAADKVTEMRSYRAIGGSSWTFPEESVDLYINWQHITGSIMFTGLYDNGRTNAERVYSGYAGEPVTDGKGNRITEAPDPGTREGYTFKGWRNPRNQEEIWAPEDFSFPEVFPVGSVTWWAVWEEDAVEDVENVDLYELLTEDGIAKKNAWVVLSNPGKYVLSQSVDGFTGQLQISKTGDYSIDLGGNSISFGDQKDGGIGQITIGTGALNTRSDTSLVNVSIDGGEGRGSLCFRDGGGIRLTNGYSLDIKRVDMESGYLRSDKLTSYQGLPVLSAAGNAQVVDWAEYPKTQVLTIDDCTFSLDVSNQVGGGSTTHAGTSAAVALDLTSPNLSAVDIKDTNVFVHTGKPAKAEDSAQGSVDAIALYCCCPATSFTIEDSVFTAQADQGSAYAVYRFHSHLYSDSPGATLLGNIELNAVSGGVGQQFAVGLLNTVRTYKKNAGDRFGASIVLDCSLSANLDGPGGLYALASDAANSDVSHAPFTIGQDFRAQTELPSLMDLDFGASFENNGGDITSFVPPTMPVSVGSAANMAGTYLASFAENVSDRVKETIALSFSNGLEGSKTVPISVGDGVKFELDIADAEAYIVRDGSREGGAFEDVARNARSGETVVLNRNLDRAVSFPATNEEATEGADVSGLSYRVDLNGRTVAAFRCESSALVTLCSSAEFQPALSGALISGTICAVRQEGQGTLKLENVPVDVNGSTRDACGIVVGSGTVEVQDANVIVKANAKSATGIIVSGGSLDVYGGKVVVEKALEGGFGRSLSISAGGDASLRGVDLSATGPAGCVAGIKASGGSVSIAPSDDGNATMVSVKASHGSGAVYGIEADEGSSVSLFEAAIAVSPADDVDESGREAMEAWGIYASKESGEESRSSVLLDGTCSISLGGLDGGHIHHEGITLGIGPGFATGGEEPITVESSDLDPSDVFASPSDEGSLEGKADLFAPVERDSNRYAGWEARVSGDSLAWRTDAVASVDGAMFRSLSAALAAAGEGSTVTVLRDCASLPLAISRTVELDLNGKSVKVRSAIPSTRGPVKVAASIAVSDGRFTVKDSSSGMTGNLVIEHDSSAVADAKESYGINVTGDGGLTLNGARVYIYFAGDGTVTSLIGVGNDASGRDDGPCVELTGADLNVGSNSRAVGLVAGQTGVGGARSVVGVQDSSSYTEQTLSVDGSSSIRVRTTMGNASAGSIVTSTQTSLTGNENALNTASIRRFEPESDPELYEEICEAFKVNAKFDASKDSGVFGARLYYASPMELGDGTYAWAFSDIVAGDNVGTEDAIVPSIIYLQSTYESPATATIVSTTEGARGKIWLSGRLRASSEHGNARGVSAVGMIARTDDAITVMGGSTWRLENIDLKVESLGDAPYLTTVGTPDLKELLGYNGVMGTKGQKNFYPSGSGVTEVVEKQPSATGVWNLNDACDVTFGADVNIETYAIEEADIAGLVNIDGEFTHESVLAVKAGSGSNQQGAVFAKLGTGDEITSAQRDLFADVDGEFLPVLEDSGRSLAWGAAYDVSFLDAYGRVVESKRFADGYEVEPPDASTVPKPPSETMEYVLVGWSLDPKAKEGDEGVHATGVAFVLDPKSMDGEASGTTYYPVYRGIPRRVSYTFAGARDSSGASMAQVTVGVISGGGMSAEEVAQVPQPSSYGDYVFVGWEADLLTRVSAPNRTVDPADIASVESTKDITFTAKYVHINSGQRLVVFKVDSYLYAYTVEEGVRPSFAEAMRSATGSDQQSEVDAALDKRETGEKWVFAGWVEGWHDFAGSYPEQVTYGPTDKLPAVAAEMEATYFTAVFTNEGKTTVTVTLHYYNRWRGVWTYNQKALTTSGGIQPEDQYKVSYGTEIGKLAPGVDSSTVDPGLAGVRIIDYAANTGSASDPVYRERRFLGWSTRVEDKVPLPSSLLPRAGSGTLEGGYTANSENYYAVYSDSDMKATVTFAFGDGSLEVQVSANGTLEDALVALAEAGKGSSYGSIAGGAFVPDAPDGKKFSGWAASEESAAIGNPALSKISKAASFDAPKEGDGRCEGSVTYYAVFVDADRASVTLDGNGADNWGANTNKGTAGADGRAEFDDGYVAPYRNGCAFTGWNTARDGSGRSFDVSKDVLEGNMTLYAQYEPIDTSKVAATDVAVDISRSHASGGGSLGADPGGIMLLLDEERDDDASIALGQRDRAISYYRLRLVAIRDGDTVDITDQMEGSVSVTLPVPADYEGEEVLVFAKAQDGSSKVYSTTKADSSIQDISGQKPGASAVTARISSIGSSSAGNITLAYRMTQAEYSLELARNSAKEQLEEIYSGYSKGDYSADNWDALGSAYTSGQSAINAAKTTAEIKSAAQAASDAMAAIPAKAGVEAAKAEGLERLANSLSDYDKSAYSDESWEELITAYDKAKKAVKDAKTAAEANKAASDGVLAMASVRPGTPSSGSGGSNEGSGSNGGSSSASGTGLSGSTGSGSSTGGLSSNLGGLTSSSGGLTSSTGSGLLSGSRTTSQLSSTGTSSGLTSNLATSSTGGLSNGVSGLASTANSDYAGTRLGGKLSTVDKSFAKEKGLKVESGVYVESTDSGGPLDRAGIEPGDVIVSVDGKEVKTKEDLEKLLSEKKAGDEIDIAIDRGGKRVTYTVAVGEAPAGTGLTSSKNSLFGGSDEQNSGLGGENASGANLSDLSWILPALIAGLLLSVLVAALVWWLMRRRNQGDEEPDDGYDPDEDFWEEAPTAA